MPPIMPLEADQGEKCNFESSRAKVVCAEAEWRVADRCVQILGGQGVTNEQVVMRIFKDMRAFRIYDGPSEVRRWSMARKFWQLMLDHERIYAYNISLCTTPRRNAS